MKSTSAVTNVYFDGDSLFAYAGGHLFCLEPKDGTVIWENDLPGMGFGPCIMASENQTASAVASHVAAQQASIAGAVVATTATSSSS